MYVPLGIPVRGDACQSKNLRLNSRSFALKNIGSYYLIITKPISKK